MQTEEPAVREIVNLSLGSRFHCARFYKAQDLTYAVCTTSILLLLDKREESGP